MKPIKPMSKEAKLARAEKAKKAKIMQTIETKISTEGPPKNRLSFSGCHHLGSPPDEWEFIHGIGWLHVSEKEWLDDAYFKSGGDGRYHPRSEAIPTCYPDTFISVKELGGEWAMCEQADRATRKEDMVEVLTSKGKTAYANKRYCPPLTHDYYCVCPILNRLAKTDTFFRFTNPITPEFKSVSMLGLKSSPLFSPCPKCGNHHEKIGILMREELGGPACNDCYTKHVLKNIIHKHDYNGYPNVLSSNPTNRLLVKGKITHVPDDTVRLFGVECEVEISDSSKFTRWELATRATQVLGKDFIVMKNDGSLKEHDRESPLWGFEMVTAPADLATHRQRWAQLESMEGFKYLRAWDTKTCGMHVHVGKIGLTTLQIGRIMMFITHKNNRKFIEKVAGRNSAAASRFVDKGIDGALKPDPDKYCAVNIRPVHTIEFRIFRGTIRYQHIIRNLEFCEAVCAFAHPSSRSFDDFRTHTKFLEYCSENRKLYPFLTKWMAHPDQKMIPVLKPGNRKPHSVSEEVVEPVPTETGCADKWYS